MIAFVPSVAILTIAAVLAGCDGGATRRADFPRRTAAGSGAALVDSANSASTPEANCTSPDSEDNALLSMARRLTNDQYRNSLYDLFSVEAFAETSSMPSDSAGSMFRNATVDVAISALKVEKYAEAAATLASKIVEPAAAHCDKANSECFRSVLSRIGALLFRRPLDDKEREIYERLFVELVKEESPYDALTSVTSALLQAPPFLYRLERGATTEPLQKTRALTGSELATRLAFFLWNSSPDDALVKAMEAGAFKDPEKRLAVFKSMLVDPRAKRAFLEFSEEWLALSDLGNVQHMTSRFPDFSQALLSDMREEILAFMAIEFFEKNGDMRRLFAPETHYLSARLAAIYGVKSVDEGFAPYPSTGALAERGGLLGFAALSTLTTIGDEPNPVKRGLFIAKRILCAEIPPPAAGAFSEELALRDDVTARERLELHQKSPTCAGCHRIFDGLGLSLEGFDAIGRARVAYPSLKPIDTSGKINIAGRDYDFGGAADLGKILSTDEAIPRCIARNTFEYATGVKPAETQCGVVSASRAFANGQYRYKALLWSIVYAPEFTQITDGT